MHRLPSTLAWLAIFLMLRVGWDGMYGPDADCDRARNIMTSAAWGSVILIALSFYSFFPLVDFLSLSPLLRQIHQVTRYFYVGRSPPRMLYMTDGGVKDCTGVLQLMMRRCERILLVLAAGDPTCEFVVVFTAFEVAKKLKLGTFYDPEDPTRDISLLFKKYQGNPEILSIELGISYALQGDETTKARLVIVKNRLVPSKVGRIQPLISREEIVEESLEEESEASEWELEGHSLDDADLGGFGCCDCCHSKGMNCGPKFPHGTFPGYLYLSPQWCSSLMRLGFNVSPEAIDKVVK